MSTGQHSMDNVQSAACTAANKSLSRKVYSEKRAGQQVAATCMAMTRLCRSCSGLQVPDERRQVTD